MPIIGEFIRDDDGVGFVGHLTTLLLNQDIIIVPAELSEVENAPQYRVHVFDGMNNEVGPEIGAGWNRIGEKAGAYVALQFDDPSFAQPVRANLFRNDDAGRNWSLHWTRPSARERKD